MNPSITDSRSQVASWVRFNVVIYIFPNLVSLVGECNGYDSDRWNLTLVESNAYIGDTPTYINKC